MAQQQQQQEQQPIVVAVDGSRDSRSALLWALGAVAGAGGGGAPQGGPVQVHLVHVVRPQEDFIMDLPEMQLIPKTVGRDAVQASAAKVGPPAASSSACLGPFRKPHMPKLRQRQIVTAFGPHCP
jgi:hypothetical protein